MRPLSILGLALCGASLLPMNLAHGQTVAQMIAAGGVHNLALIVPTTPFSPATDRVVMNWGDNSSGQCNIPPPNVDFVAIAAGGYHSLGLKSDGRIVAWGDNSVGQCNIPTPNAGFMAIAAGHSHNLGLRPDGTIVTWGYNSYGQCNVPAPNANFVAVSGGGEHSLGLKSDATVVAWGNNLFGQCNVPIPNAGFAAIEAGPAHSLGLKSDGTVVAWGYNFYGQCNIPAPNANFLAISAGGNHSLGLKSDGSIVAWGDNSSGQCNVPAPNADFVAVSTGFYHSMGLKSDGTIVVWGDNTFGQLNVPPYPTGTPPCPANQFDGVAYYDAATGTVTAEIQPVQNGGVASAFVTDDFVIVNLPTGSPVTFTGHMDWVEVHDPSCPADITETSPIFPAQVFAGVPFRLDFSAVIAVDCSFGFDHYGSVQGHLSFSDLPPGAVVRSCQGFVQGNITAVLATPAAPAALAIRRLSPNPSSGLFDASITLASDSPSALDVFDVRGRLVTRGATKGLGSGEHRVAIRASSDLASGIYFIRLTQGSRTVWAKAAIVH